jgi:hypothetical protein
MDTDDSGGQIVGGRIMDLKEMGVGACELLFGSQ